MRSLVRRWRRLQVPERVYSLELLAVVGNQSLMRPLHKRMLITGVVLCICAPLLGLLLTAIGMVGAFHSLGEAGISDPKILAGQISTVLLATMSGFIAGTVGLVLVVVAAILHYTTSSKIPPVPPIP